MGANARQYRDPNDPCHDMATEDTLFRLLNLEFGFDLDVCATKENAKCPRYFTIEDDGLKQDWSKSTVVAWMNPPYSRNLLKRWVAKARHETLNGLTTVALLPAATDTKWWHSHVEPWRRADEGCVRFLPGRQRFGNNKSKVMFPSAVVVFKGVPSGRSK